MATEPAQEILPQARHRPNGLAASGLTEPDAGSDPGGMKTPPRRTLRRLPADRHQDLDFQRADADDFLVWAKSAEHNNHSAALFLQKS